MRVRPLASTASTASAAPFASFASFASFVGLASLAACAPAATAPPARVSATSAISAAAPGAAAPARVRAEDIASAIRFLSDDALEGRAPGSRGSELATKFIAAQMESSGLKPGGDAGSYFQKVPLVAIAAAVPPTVKATGKGGQLALSVPKDLVVMSGVQAVTVDIPPSELVFVGYGIVAPEHQWDDYKDVDVKGKIVVVMNNDPSTDPKLFGGTTRFWYGRWDYKYLQAAKKGAAGVIIVHTTPSAGYPWQVVETSNQTEKFELPAGTEPRVLAKMWATEDASKKLAALGGVDLDALRRAAESREFRPRPLGAKMELSFVNRLRRIESTNVIGVLPGSDKVAASEAVVFTAHHDHLGLGAPKNGDPIYNGAVDNASGVAGILAIARAAQASPPARRSLVFMAVTAEEQGLLGSEWYCEHPTFPAGRIAADLNMDSLNVFGPTRDVGYVGLGKSSLDEVVQSVARSQGRAVHGDAFPDRGAFYRSDQFSFAKIGVPSIYARGGPEYVGRPQGWGKEQMETFEKTRYHQPSDEFDPKWDLRGAVEDAELLLLAGLKIANAPELPAWTKGDEFASIPRPR